MTPAPAQPDRVVGAQAITTTARFVVSRGRPVRDPAAVPTPTPGRVPRVARLMALAIRFDNLLRTGAVSTQAELAAAGHVTRARVTQIMNLLHLAPDIQEAVLHLPPVTNGRDPITEHDLRVVTSKVEWQTQRQLWQSLRREPCRTGAVGQSEVPDGPGLRH